MALLNYDVLKKSGYDGYILEDAPVKVLQFGEGNFLRAFVDYWFDLANEKAGWNGKCCLVQPIAPGLAKMINEQEGLYTLYLRGSENGKKVDDKRVISSVANCLNPYEKADYDKMMEVAAIFCLLDVIFFYFFCIQIPLFHTCMTALESIYSLKHFYSFFSYINHTFMYVFHLW